MKVIDNQAWVEEQFSTCDLGHKRRTDRLKIVAKNLLASPENSLVTQNVRWSDVKAAYTLFARSEVTFEAVAQLHWEKTRQTAPGRYLLISDTSDINHTSHRHTEGLGILGDGKGQGMQLHSCLMYDCNAGQIRGQAGATIYYRKRVPKKETRKQRLARYRESSLWGELVDSVGSAPAGSRWIHVFDRGGDNFEAICRIQLKRCDYVIRAAKLNRNLFDEQGNKLTLEESVGSATEVGSYQLDLRARPGVAARSAKLKVSVTKVRMPQPARRSAWIRQCGIKELSVNVVVVEEVEVASGVKPIRWVLLTSLPTETFDEAWQVIEDYEHRWLIEEYHKVIKSGCAIERHALRMSDRLEPLIGLIAVVGTRLLQLKLVGRNQPDARAQSHVPSSWLKSLKLARPKLKLTEMTVYTFFREVAKLGGFLGRKCDGEPGWQTIWRGYQKLQSLLDAMKLIGAK